MWFYHPTSSQESELREFYADIREKAFQFDFMLIHKKSKKIVIKWFKEHIIKILTIIGEDENINMINHNSMFLKKRVKYYTLFKDLYGYYLKHDSCLEIITKHAKVALGIWNDEQLQDFHFRICASEVRFNCV